MELFLKKILLIVLLPQTLMFCSKHADSVVTVKPPVAVNYSDIITSESNFILAHLVSDGGFTMSSNKEVAGYKIEPYFNNIAARALLENPTDSQISAVKNWVVWYMIHLNPDGSVYDYYADNYSGPAALTSTHDFDSMDSYAATFLSLVRRLCEVSPSARSWLTNNYSAQLKKIGEVLVQVTDSDGLTIAKPSYPVKYTMDNAEVNKGLSDMQWLSANIIAGGDSARWQTLLNKNTFGMETNLWDQSNGRYFMYKGGPVASWTTFYADATCQLYPIWCNVISPNSARAQNLWNTFNANYPYWSSGTIYDAGGYPWTLLCYAAAVMNDKTRTDNYLRYVQTYTSRGTQPTSNWYNLEAAFVIFAASKMK